MTVHLWVDANVILCFLTGDPPEMAARALELMHRAEKGDLRLRLSPVVVAELVLVLHSFYRFDKGRIAETLSSLLRAEGVLAEDAAVLIEALQDMTRKNVDFVDAYLAALARSRGESVCSFDADSGRLNVRWATPPETGQVKQSRSENGQGERDK